MTASEKHNRLAQVFITSVVKEIIDDGGSYGEVMVVLESVVLGVMIANSKAFGLKPSVASGLVEAAVQRAMVRYTEQTR